MPARPLALLALAVLAATASSLGAASVTATLQDGAGKPLADAVVSLRLLDAPAETATPAEPPDPAPSPETTVKIAQIREEYRPYVTAVQVGTRVEFPNLDEVQHHLYSVSKAKPFEKPLYDRGESESIVFDQPGVVTLGCNIHDWMVAYVVVLETPRFAVSSAEGVAVVADLAPGRHTLEIWHPRLATPLTREITVGADDLRLEPVALKLKPDRRVRRSPAGEDRTY